MKVVNCTWEQENIGKKTVEITVEENDIFNIDAILQSVNGYEYAVVKVPMSMPEFNFGLTELGFACIETQLTVGKKTSDFDYSKTSHLYDDTSYQIVENDNEFNYVVSNIKSGMFSTDRISIDPHFGFDIGCKRYINWLTTEYKSKKSSLIRVVYKGHDVGFMLVRIEGDTIDLLLNGLYKPYQGKGLGLLTPASPMLYVKKNNLPITQEVTSISSNNIPVVKLYNRLNFNILRQTYVFVKHI